MQQVDGFTSNMFVIQFWLTNCPALPQAPDCPQNRAQLSCEASGTVPERELFFLLYFNWSLHVLVSSQHFNLAAALRIIRSRLDNAVST